MTSKKVEIFHFDEPTKINVEKLKGHKVLWIFDIDETLLQYDQDKEIFYPFNNEIQEWMRKIIRMNHPICLLTARYPPSNIQPERDLFHVLHLSEETDTYYTLNSKIPLFNYTSGELKGDYAKKIIEKYLENEHLDAIFFLDDRLTQIESVINVCKNLHNNIYGIWISAHSYEKDLMHNYNLLLTE